MDSSTVASNVIPFDFRGHGVRAISVCGEAWFVAADICKVLGQSNTTKALYALDDDERSNFKLGRQGVVNIINESGLYTLTLRCDDAIKKGSTAHAFRKWVTGEVLPAIRSQGKYVDHFDAMGDLVGAVIGTSGEHVLDRVIDQKASPVPQALQRSFKHTMKSRLRSRFNVQRTALIPAENLNDACNFVAAYALEGEWIGRTDTSLHTITDKEMYDIGFLMSHFLSLKKIYEDWNLGTSLRMLGSPVASHMVGHFHDAMMAVGELKKRSPDMELAAQRLGLGKNGKRSAA